MTIATAGLALLAMVLSGHLLSPTESATAGKRVESDSYTSPAPIARCIAYNVGKKRPDLHVRARAGDASDGSMYLILTRMEAASTTVGVIRVKPNDAGSHLTIWLNEERLSTDPAATAHKLIAGC